jgi:uncharacterized alpha-E superfamily protein
VLLSRVAENLYWAARYLERSEDTARVIRQHTELLVDLPISIPLRWEPLLAIMGTEEEFVATGVRHHETEIVSYLASDRTNPGSIVSSVAAARENLRTTREVIPREAWETVNDIFLFVTARSDEGVVRATRSKYLSHLIGECQRMVGMLAGSMSRDSAYEMMRLGRNLERADMTTRVLDVRASSLLREDAAFADLQWAGVLKSLSAFQMFRRTTRNVVDGDPVVRFCLADESFPRSVAHCLDEVASCLGRLPRAGFVGSACDEARQHLASAPLDGLSGDELHRLADELQVRIGAIHEQVASAYFAGSDALPAGPVP